MSLQEFQAEPTEDLIEYMKIIGPDDKASANDAFRAFVLRFREFVQKLCRRVAINFGYDTVVGDQIAEQTFLKFRAAKTFRKDKCNSPDLDACVKYYLAITASRAMVDYDRDENSDNPFDGTEELAFDLPDIDDLAMDPERLAVLKKQHDIVEMVLGRLSSKHRVVYLTYKQYELDLHRRESTEDGRVRKFYLPRPLTEKLRKETGLAQSTIRKYKEEANRMIEELLRIYGNK
jgi:DNA-directed RNA polymerase specialized sigma24 family protein